MNPNRSFFFFSLSVLTALVVLFEFVTLFKNIPEVGQDSAIVFVHPNLTVREIAQLLKNHQVLEVGWKFRLLSKIFHAEKKLKPGEYRFRQPSSPYEALSLLMGGKVILHKVTFPEGSTLMEMAHTLEQNQLAKASDLVPRFHDPVLIQKLDIPAASIEGFLFPDTYFFSKLDDEIKIIKTMHDRFREEITPERLEAAKQLHLDLLKWVTLASIIEKESGVLSEQPIISSVFQNRLKKRMRLQSDPTVIYGIPNYDGNI